MKTLVAACFAFLLVATCTQKKQPLLGDTAFQRTLNGKFKDASKSPLTDKERRDFNGLVFFTFDSTFVVQATFKRTEEEQPFKMKTTTDRLATFLKYGEVRFVLKGKDYQLNIYQDQDLLIEEGYEDYLFLPFLDDTNGEESYGAGRYIDLRIPETNQMTIDFNTAYNPFCAYNVKFSCPIVPRVNYLDTEVKAGVKDYIK